MKREYFDCQSPPKAEVKTLGLDKETKRELNINGLRGCHLALSTRRIFA